MFTYSEFLLERRRDFEDEVLDEKDKCLMELLEERWNNCLFIVELRIDLKDFIFFLILWVSWVSFDCCL